MADQVCVPVVLVQLLSPGRDGSGTGGVLPASPIELRHQPRSGAGERQECGSQFELKAQNKEGNAPMARPLGITEVEDESERSQRGVREESGRSRGGVGEESEWSQGGVREAVTDPVPSASSSLKTMNMLSVSSPSAPRLAPSAHLRQNTTNTYKSTLESEHAPEGKRFQSDAMFRFPHDDALSQVGERTDSGTSTNTRDKFSTHKLTC
ncbi:unnamed protein product [Pleuronectes platessa]|uniref:Uncharacterized protein n=1 Tax=Pleuronectes platessa TaxID=8262 RepID=A0A9N7Z5X4_PLEPL|nr:unnamed protein product [Pleuronectes platessa]